MVLRTRQELRCSQAGGRGQTREGGDHQRGAKGGRGFIRPWVTFLEQVGCYPSPRGLGWWTVSKRGSLGPFLSFFVLQRRAQAHESLPRTRPPFAVAGAVRPEQLDVPSNQEPAGGPGGQKALAHAPHICSPAERHCGSETF